MTNLDERGFYGQGSPLAHSVRTARRKVKPLVLRKLALFDKPQNQLPSLAWQSIYKWGSASSCILQLARNGDGMIVLHLQNNLNITSQREGDPVAAQRTETQLGVT